MKDKKNEEFEEDFSIDQSQYEIEDENKVAKPKAHAFITEPNKTMINIQHINDAKQMCNGLMYGFSSGVFTNKEKRMTPMNITPKILGMRILLNNGTS